MHLPCNRSPVFKDVNKQQRKEQKNGNLSASSFFLVLIHTHQTCCYTHGSAQTATVTPKFVPDLTWLSLSYTQKFTRLIYYTIPRQWRAYKHEPQRQDTNKAKIILRTEKKTSIYVCGYDVRWTYDTVWREDPWIVQNNYITRNLSLLVAWVLLKLTHRWRNGAHGIDCYQMNNYNSVLKRREVNIR